jgi:hypothetical protein
MAMSKISVLHFKNELTDKEQINFIPFNRTGRVRADLIKTMNKFGFIVPIIMIKTSILDGIEKLYVVDGHNRVATARFLKIPYFGILLDVKFFSVEELVSFISSLNNTQKAWTNYEYITAFAHVGKKDYQELIKLKSTVPFSISTMACMLHGSSRFSISSVIKNGNFKISKLKETKDTIDYAGELSKYKPLTNRMVMSLQNVMSLEIFDKKKFTEAYAKYCHKINKLSLDSFEDTFISWLEQ